MTFRRKLLVLLIGAPLLGIVVAVAIAPGYAWRYLRFVAGGADLDQPRLVSPVATLSGSNQPPPPALSPEDAGISAQALRLAAEYAKPRNSSALIVARRGHRVFEAYFDGASLDSRVDVGGWSALLTALAVGVAIDERKVALLDEPAANYLPEWRDGDRALITLRHLLTQMSGLEPAAGRFAPWSAAVRERLTSDRTALLLARPLAQTPGRVHVASSGDLALIGIVLARATRQDPLEYLSQALWRPLGAADAAARLDRAGGAPHLDCCLGVRIGDWLRVGMLLAQDGVYEGTQVVSAEWLRVMRAPAANGAQRGIVVRWDGDYAAREIFRVEGRDKQRIWFVPSLQLVIVRTGAEPEASQGWDDATIPDLIVRGTAGFVPRAAPNGRQIDPGQFAPGH